ncbi:MAG: response regulator, partial [Bdellovibrionota bacterium]
MKPESGYVLLVHLKSISGVMPVPVIVLSAKDDQKSIQQAMNLGISEFVTKPLNAAKFIQKIRKNIRGEEIARHTFPAGSPCSVNVSLPGRIVAASEIGFRLVTSIRLECQSMVTVKSPFLDQLSIQDYPLKSGPVLAKAFEHGQYNNEIRLAGVTREISNRTRKLMMTWK